MFVSMFPCNECAKLIIQSGIKRVVYICDKYSETEQIKASKILFQMAQIQLEQFIPRRSKIIIDFNSAVDD